MPRDQPDSPDIPDTPDTPNTPTTPVTAREVLAALMEIRRLGPGRSLSKLEEQQPELAEYLMEALTQAHSSLLNLGAAARPSQKVYLEFKHIVLVCAFALRPGADSSHPPDAAGDVTNGKPAEG